jgi:hypothetical protein
MALVFAYSLDGEHAGAVVDQALDTATNYKNGVGTNGVTKGDLVFQAAGLVKRTINAATPKAIGVVEGTEFLGLVAPGQPYAAAKGSFTAQADNTTLYPNGVVKVRRDPSSVYKVPVKAGQAATVANRGIAYGISQDAAGDQSLDLTQTANALLKIEDIAPDGKFVFVTIIAAALV